MKYSLYILFYFFQQLIVYAQNDQPVYEISAANLSKYYAILSDDSLHGRATGSPGCYKTAHYIAGKLKEFNIGPAVDGSYFQNIQMHSSIPLKSSKLRIITNKKDTIADLGKDYLLYTSGAQTFIPNPVQLVFAGYGILAPEFDYNDYQSIDVEGKVVIFISGEPKSNDQKFFNGNSPTIYSTAEAKQRIAFSRGAKGSIFIPNPLDAEYKGWEYKINQFSFENVTLSYSVTGNFSAIMNPDFAPILFDDSESNLASILKMAFSGSLKSFPLNSEITFYGEFKERDFFSHNIAGIINGIDPELKDTYIILSAHYDHLGVGPATKGDSIYNGTIDNASGVSVLLEIARVLSTTKPKKSVLLLFLTGEEKGLLGSRFYTDHPLYPLHKTTANINIDGIAFLGAFRNIIGIGVEFSTLNKNLEQVAEEFNLKVSQIPPEFLLNETFMYSDQYQFALAGIPSILISEGTDLVKYGSDQGLKLILNWMKNVYHSPFDDLNQPIDFEAALLHANIIYSFCTKLAASSEKPEWNSGAPFINARLQSIAEKR